MTVPSQPLDGQLLFRIGSTHFASLTEALVIDEHSEPTLTQDAGGDAALLRSAMESLLLSGYANVDAAGTIGVSLGLVSALIICKRAKASVLISRKLGERTLAIRIAVDGEMMTSIREIRSGIIELVLYSGQAEAIEVALANVLAADNSDSEVGSQIIVGFESWESEVPTERPQLTIETEGLDRSKAIDAIQELISQGQRNEA